MLRELFGKTFDRDVAPELGVPGPVDLAHATRTDGGEDLIRTQLRAGSERHGRPFGCDNSPSHVEKSKVVSLLNIDETPPGLRRSLVVGNRRAQTARASLFA